jgi:hypothetical protein
MNLIMDFMLTAVFILNVKLGWDANTYQLVAAGLAFFYLVRIGSGVFQVYLHLIKDKA